MNCRDQLRVPLCLDMHRLTNGTLTVIPLDMRLIARLNVLLVDQYKFLTTY